MDILLKCQCGSVHGVAKEIVPRNGNRVVCMCDDCQAYAHHLGCGDKVLDPNGGTDIFQTTPSQIEIVDGHKHLRCLRLTPKGLLRWYAGCCNTPMANTAGSARIPFTGVVHTFMDHSRGPTRDETLGPILARIQGRFAVGELPRDAHLRMPVGLMLRTLRLLASAFFRGAHKPSPFFDAKSGRPFTLATVLSTSERENLRAVCGSL